MVFPKGYSFSLLLFVAFVAMNTSIASAQIGFKGNDKFKTFLTLYNSSENKDSTFILDYFKTGGKLTRNITKDTLFVHSPRTGKCDFAWYKLDATAKPITSNLLSVDSSFNVKEQGGFAVKISQTGWDTTFLAWVFFADTLNVKIDKTAEGKVKEFSCSSFLLKSTVTSNIFTYADPLTGIAKEFDENKIRKIQWSPSGMRDPSAASTRVYGDLMPTENKTYTITVTSIFNNEVTNNVIYESVIPKANFSFEYQKVDSVDNKGNVTTKWENVSASDSLSALALVKFKNTSINAQKYTWFLSDTVLGKYTPEPHRVDTSLLAFEPEYRYYIPRIYKPMLVAINTKLGCRDTVVYKPADIGTKDYMLTIGKSKINSEAMPNVFTPNGDHANDYFRPEMKSIKSFHLYVYNRLGRKVYEYNHNENDPIDLWPGWDGNLSSGSRADVGLYYYVMEARGWDGTGYRTKRYSGALYLYR